ncbi:MAG: hypothetical protein ACE5GW_14265, partial [Planctomycetota bacterium]
PQTNILFVEIDGKQPERYRRLVDGLEREGVRAVNILDERIRLVTHRGIDDDGVRHALDRFQALLAD